MPFKIHSCRPISRPYALLPFHLLRGCALGVALLVASIALAQPPPAVVETVPARNREVAQTVDLVGTVEPQRRSVVAAQVEGAVTELNVREGDRVEAGQTLALLDAEELRIRVEAVRSGRAELDARQQEQQGRFQRSKELFERGRISEEEYSEDLHAAEALKFGVERAAADVRALEDQLSRKTVTAPYAGAVAETHVEPGEWVEQGDPVITLVDLAAVHAIIDLPDRLRPSLRVGVSVNVVAEATAGDSFTGKVIAIIPDADPQTHTLPVKIEITNEYGQLYGGMFVRVALPVGESFEALVVPKDALIHRQGRDILYVVEEGIAREVTVERLEDVEMDSVVSGDLVAGTAVVVRGNERLRDGQAVVVQGHPSGVAGVEPERTL